MAAMSAPSPAPRSPSSCARPSRPSPRPSGACAGATPRPAGLSFAQFHLLRRLAEVDECPASKLAAERRPLARLGDPGARPPGRARPRRARPQRNRPARRPQPPHARRARGLRGQAGGARAALAGGARRPVGRPARPGRAGAAADGRGARRDLGSSACACGRPPGACGAARRLQQSSRGGSPRSAPGAGRSRSVLTRTGPDYPRKPVSNPDQFGNCALQRTTCRRPRPPLTPSPR